MNHAVKWIQTGIRRSPRCSIFISVISLFLTEAELLFMLQSLCRRQLANIYWSIFEDEKSGNSVSGYFYQRKSGNEQETIVRHGNTLFIIRIGFRRTFGNMKSGLKGLTNALDSTQVLFSYPIRSYYFPYSPWFRWQPNCKHFVHCR